MWDTLWLTSVDGPVLQTLDWSVEQGEWSVVVMNADGSSGVDASLVLGAGLSNVVAMLWGVFALGVIALVCGGLLAFPGGTAKTRAEPGDVARDVRRQNKTRGM